jgi:NACalpha-BTF3-like transcription factor
LAIFDILEGAVRNLMAYFKKQQTGSQLKPKLNKRLQQIYYTLTEFKPINSKQTYQEMKQRVLKVITTVNLRVYERDIKINWEKYLENKDLYALVSDLDELFVDQDQYHEIEEEQEVNPLEIIEEEDIHLVCYQWFQAK